MKIRIAVARRRTYVSRVRYATSEPLKLNNNGSGLETATNNNKIKCRTSRIQSASAQIKWLRTIKAIFQQTSFILANEERI
jgi:hypothetical protein